MFEFPGASTLSDADKFKGLLICGGILFIGGVLEVYTTFMNRYRAYKCRDWPRVPGQVFLHKTRRPILSGLGRIVPQVFYSYTIGGQTYEHTAVRFGGHEAVKRDEAERVLKRYPLDSTVQVIVDPNNPRICALEETAIGGRGFTNGFAMAATGLFLLVLAILTALPAS
jgi:hypothetical protein